MEINEQTIEKVLNAFGYYKKELVQEIPVVERTKKTNKIKVRNKIVTNFQVSRRVADRLKGSINKSAQVEYILNQYVNDKDLVDSIIAEPIEYATSLSVGISKKLIETIGGLKTNDTKSVIVDKILTDFLFFSGNQKLLYKLFSGQVAEQKTF